MEPIFLWASIGVLVLFVLFGFIAGLVRGLKRSSLHIVFFAVSVLIAFAITRVIAAAVLKANITVNGEQQSISQFIINMINDQFNLSGYGTASAFVEKLPAAIVSPILFIFVTIIVCILLDIFYAIAARIWFGKKKKDFKEHKPRRSLGGLVGMVEGFFILIVLFSPITALTKTYEEITYVSQTDVQTQALSEEENNAIQTLPELVKTNVPEILDDILTSYNNSALGKVIHVSKIDYAVFDGLSSVKIDGEKIKVRKEGVEIAKTYNEIAVIVNEINAGKFENINLTNVKVAVEKILDGGLFKKLISDTLKDYIVAYGEPKEGTPEEGVVEQTSTEDEVTSEKSPDVWDELLTVLKTKVQEENFSMFEYLKHDILKLFDIADSMFKSDLLKDITDLTDKDVWKIMEIVVDEEVPTENNEDQARKSNVDAVKTMMKGFLDMNIVKDCFTPICNLASTEIEKAFKNEDNLEIALNSNIDKDKLVDDLVGAVNKLVSLNEKVNISDLVSGGDIINKLNDISDLKDVLTEVGGLLDTLRNLEIFVLPQTETRPEEVHVIDNVLATYKISLLGDKVYEKPTDEKQKEIKTYTDLLDFISYPIVTAQKFGLLDFENLVMDDVLDKMLSTLETEEDLFAKILTPIYQLEKVTINGSSLKEMVFDKMIDQLTESTNGMLDFVSVKEENSLATWTNELTLLGRTLNALNQGEIEVTTEEGTEKKTYIKYVLTDGFDIETLLNAMIDGDAFTTILDPVFEAKVFSPLVEKVFTQIDSSIESLTGVNPQTKYDNLNETKGSVIATINSLLNITLKSDMANLRLEDVGKIMDVLKENAYNNGEKNGVFNNIFANIIWYLTGESINGVDYTGYTPNENTDAIKELFNFSDENEFEDYYTADYTNIMAGLDKVVDFAKALLKNMPPITDLDSVENIRAFVNGLDASLKELGEEIDKVQMIEDLADVIGDREGIYDFISETDKTNQELANAINTAFADEEGLSDAIFKLLGMQVAENA